ncbi:MAG: membrane protein insertase YidC [Bacteroidota bacterium]
MEPQGLDRTALLGILLMSLLLGVWMIQTAPTEEQIAAQRAAADSLAAVEQAREDALAQVEVEAEDDDALAVPSDSAFAGAVGGPAREVVVVTDRVIATFSTRGGTPVSYRLRNYDLGETSQRVELVSTEAGALALGVLPQRGQYLDTRALTFRPVVDGAPFAGDTLRLDAGGELRFEAPIGDGALRFVYGFEADDYEVAFRVETPGTDLLAQSGGYDLVWDGALPFAEADAYGEVQQAGAYRSYGGDTERLRLNEPGEAELDPATGTIDWVAVKTKFFIAAVIPESPTSGARLAGEQTGELDDAGTEAFAQDYEARIEMPALGAGEAAQFTLYLGPLQLSRLADYGLYDTVDFGDWVGWMLRPIAQYVVAPVFAFLSTFTTNYGLVIIIFALIVKLALWPLTAASYRNMAKMRELQPDLTIVKEKYGEDPQKQQEAMMRVYREAGVNPLGGCLPMLLQYPLLITLWRFFQSTLVLRGEPFLWAADLSAPDPILNLPFTIPFYGNFVAGFTLLMGLSMIVSMRLSSTGAIGGQQKVLMYMMPAVFFLFFNRFPSGLSLYYLAFNIFSIFQQRLINKKVHADHEAGKTPEIDRAAEVAQKAASGKKKRNGRARRNGKLTTQAVAQNGRSRKKSKK